MRRHWARYKRRSVSGLVEHRLGPGPGSLGGLLQLHMFLMQPWLLDLDSRKNNTPSGILPSFNALRLASDDLDFELGYAEGWDHAAFRAGNDDALPF